MRDTDIAYVAGFFDGEGCISGGVCKRNDVFVHLSIAQKYPEPLLFVQRLFGGRLHQRASASNMWYHNFSSTESLQMLHTIAPFLILKRDQAELAIEFYKTAVFTGQHYTADQKAQRIAIVRKITALKRKHPC